MPTEPTKLDSGVRLEPSGPTGDFRTYGGYKFREIGLGRFEFVSRSNPSHLYTVDLFEPPYCDCWSIRTSTSGQPCCHLLVIKGYMKKLKNTPT